MKTMFKKRKRKLKTAIPPERIKAAAKIIGCTAKQLQEVMERR